MVSVPTHCTNAASYIVIATTSERYIQACAPSENSDQPALSRSLIRIFSGCIVDSQNAQFLHADNKHSSDRADAQADLSLRLEHLINCTFFLRFLTLLRVHVNFLRKIN